MPEPPGYTESRAVDIDVNDVVANGSAHEDKMPWRSALDEAKADLVNDKDAQEIIQLLESMDEDHDGNFSVHEIIDAAKSILEERRSQSLKAEIDKIWHQPHVTKEDKAALAILQEMDKDGDGKFSGDEVLEGARKIYQKNNMIRHLRCAVVVQVVIIMLLLAAMLATSMAAYELSKETQVPADGVMRTSGAGGFVQVAQQRKTVPLGGLLYMPAVFQTQLDTFSVKVPDGSRLNLRVQEITSNPSLHESEGVQRPPVRRITVQLDVKGSMQTKISPNSEGLFEEHHMRRPALSALARVLPQDAQPLNLEAKVATEVELFGDSQDDETEDSSGRRLAKASLNVVQGRRLQVNISDVVVTPIKWIRRLGMEVQDFTVDMRLDFTFSTVRRSLGTLEGIRQMTEGFGELLLEELKEDGFDLKISTIEVGSMTQKYLPQLSIKTQSGAELSIFDAGHAELRRVDTPDIHEFCASCGECSALSIDDSEFARKAEETRLSDLHTLNNHTDGRRLQLTTCEGCSADFPPRIPGAGEGQQKQSRTGPPVLSCFSEGQGNSKLPLDGVQVVQIQNMKSQYFGDFTMDQFESVRQCSEMAWLHKNTCGRDNAGKVHVSFQRQTGQYGTCYCEAVPGVVSPVSADQGEEASTYLAFCDVEQAPRLFIGVALTALRDDDHYGIHYSKQNFVERMDETNKFFSGHMQKIGSNYQESSIPVHDDVRIRFFALGMRTHTSTAYYRSCWDQMRVMAEDLAPDDFATLNLFTCAGKEHDSGGARTNGWAISTAVMQGPNSEGTNRHKTFSVWLRDDIMEGFIDSPKTLPHEFGHVIGLKHTWGSQGSGSCATSSLGDHVPDTAINLKAQGSTCSSIADSCPGVGLLAGEDHHSNVMGYCAGESFTYGQMSRMMEMVVRSRPSMWLRGAFWPLVGCSGTEKTSYAADASVWTQEFMVAGRDGCVQLCIPDPSCMGIKYQDSGTCTLLTDVTEAPSAAGVQCWFRRGWRDVMKAPRKLKWSATPTGATPSNWHVWTQMEFEKIEWPLHRGRPLYRNTDPQSAGKYLAFYPAEQRWFLAVNDDPASTSKYAYMTSDAAYPHTGVWEFFVNSGWYEYMVTITPVETELDTVPINLDSVCGNGRKEAGEDCDDGNLAPFDQCSPTCKDSTKYLFLRTERGADNAFTASASIRFSFVDRPGHPEQIGLHIVMPDDADQAKVEMSIYHPDQCPTSPCAVTTDWVGVQHEDGKMYTGVLLRAAVIWMNIPFIDDRESPPLTKVRLKMKDGTVTDWSEAMCPDQNGCGQ